MDAFIREALKLKEDRMIAKDLIGSLLDDNFVPSQSEAVDLPDSDLFYDDPMQFADWFGVD